MKPSRSCGAPKASAHREARRRVDAHIEQEPLLRVQIETQRSDTRRRFFFWFLLVDLAIVAGVVYWLFYRSPA